MPAMTGPAGRPGILGGSGNTRHLPNNGELPSRDAFWPMSPHDVLWRIGSSASLSLNAQLQSMHLTTDACWMSRLDIMFAGCGDPAHHRQAPLMTFDLKTISLNGFELCAAEHAQGSPPHVGLVPQRAC